ncbi:MAG: indolepyruvate ferredoxin oxidoreductase subunit alpha [Thermoplasmata archaeon]|nr:MAG: indolepyruvate ferredoxin oxidoreductase subunit alpha [Thermoplasmata archaeon]
MSFSDVLADEAGKRVILMGNVAIARGFLEGGINVAASYPGTPSSEIMATLIALSRKFDMYVEWSVNEKVAAEVAIAASLSGLRSMVSMKGVGVNVASEPFMAFTYMGAKGGIVLVSADDVGMHSSHTEQDNRFFAREAYIPVFEPFDPREARDMARDALSFSEEWGQPIMLRTTTRIAHTSSDIVLGDIPNEKRQGAFERNHQRWVNLPQNARKMRKGMMARMNAISQEVNNLPYNRIEGKRGGEAGIIASGIAYGYVKDALNWLGLSDELTLLKIGTPHPLPEKLVKDVLSESQQVLVVEELEPFVEMQVRAQANKLDISVPVTGKELLPLDGELSMIRVMEALCKVMDMSMPIDVSKIRKTTDAATSLVPPRPPVLCPGCGHRPVFYAINIVERRYKKNRKDSMGFIKPSDIGCYTLGFQQPLSAVDTNFCMGASIGVSGGFSQVVDDPVLCTIGDSTFFHAGIPPLLNAVFNKADITVVILDNRTTAMTGFQPHPGVGRTAGGNPTSEVSIEEVIRACGVQYIRSVDAYNIDDVVEALEGGVKHEGPAAVIAQGLCRMLSLKAVRAGEGDMTPVCVDEELCVDCRLCIDRFGCPAMYVSENRVAIDSNLCNGCMVCMQESVCKKKAIKVLEGGD